MMNFWPAQKRVTPVGGEHGEPAEKQHDGTALAEHQNHENEGDYVRVSQQVEMLPRQHVVHVFLQNLLFSCFVAQQVESHLFHHHQNVRHENVHETSGNQLRAYDVVPGVVEVFYQSVD